MAQILPYQLVLLKHIWLLEIDFSFKLVASAKILVAIAIDGKILVTIATWRVVLTHCFPLLWSNNFYLQGNIWLHVI